MNSGRGLTGFFKEFIKPKTLPIKIKTKKNKILIIIII